MAVVDRSVEENASASPAAVPARAGVDRRRRLTDIAVLVGFAALAVFVMHPLWGDPNGRALSGNYDDHNIFMFMVGHGDRVVFHGADVFFSDRINVPDGVNMMAQTSILALSLPIAPITHYLGVGVSIALLLTLGLALTAAAWYVVLARHLVRSRAAAFVGGLWCGFAPAMVSHANGHVNFVSQYVVPFIVWQSLRLSEPGRVWRSGVVLGLLIVLQAFINEETLLFTALALGAFVAAYAAMAPRVARAVARRMVAGLAVAAAVSGTLLAYPLWFQFFGPRTYQGQPFEPEHYVTDLLSLGAFARQSLAGDSEVASRLSVSATEDNTFFGLPVLIMLVVAGILLRRSVAARAAALAGLVLLVMSLGPRLRVGGHDTAIPLPFGLFSDVPVLDLVSVTRFAIVPATVVGVLLALAADRMTADRVTADRMTADRMTAERVTADRNPAPSGPGSLAEGESRLAAAAQGYPHRVRVAFWVALVAALVPVAPTPVPVVPAAAPPAFITEGLWRPYVPTDRTLITVPLPEVTTGRDGVRWGALAHYEFAAPRGYFMGPVDPPTDTTGSWSAPRRPTSDLLAAIAGDGRRRPVTPAARRAATADLIFWRAAVLVLVPHPHAEVLRTTVTDLVGRAPQQIGGAVVWDLRDLPVPPAG